MQQLELTPEREVYLHGFRPVVRFVIPSADDLHDYLSFLMQLLAEFMLDCDDRNRTRSNYQLEGSGFRNWNEEGGIGSIFINNIFIAHCKVYLCDGSEESSIHSQTGEPWRGIIFRDHGDETSRFGNTVKVFLLSDAFETFLKKREIAFQRQNSEYKQ